MPKYQRIVLVDKQQIYGAFLRHEDYVELPKQLSIKAHLTIALAINKGAEENSGQVARARGGVRPSSVKVTDSMIEAAVNITQDQPELRLTKYSRSFVVD